MEESSTTARVAEARNILSSQVSGGVTVPNSAEYPAEREKPCAEEVASVLKTVKDQGIKFAIRGGGHNANPGVAAVDMSGVVIDMRELNSMSLDESDVLHVGAGATWGEVYTYLEDRGRVAIGGRHKDVGLGGYMLGGGMPAFQNLHGLAVDNLKSCEVVLADSSIVIANAQDKPDLFRALKGGGTNFGIATRYGIQTYPLIHAQYTVNVYNVSDHVNIFKATAQVQQAMEHDPKAGMFVFAQPTMIAVGLLYSEWAEESPKVFQPILKLGSLLQAAVPTTNGTIKSMAETLSFIDTFFRRCVGSTSSRVSEDLYIGVQELCFEIRNAHPRLSSLGYTIQPLSTPAIQIGEDQGGNSMGIAKVPQSAFNADKEPVFALVAEWNDAADDAEGEMALNELREGIQRLARDKGQFLDFIFMNDASSKQAVLASYGSESVKKLQDAARKYDPEGVFQKLQNDGFLLRKL